MRGRRAALEEIAALIDAPVRIEDTQGRALFGDAEGGGRHPVEVDGEALGAVFGPPGAAPLARVLAAFVKNERELVALAGETLDRYKELTLLYDMSDALARVLDVDEVANMVVAQAHRHLRAGGASLFVCERSGDPPRVLAAVGDDAPDVRRRIPPGGIEARVLDTGRAEMVEAARVDGVDGELALMCAPLRSGDAVIGLLRVTRGRARRGGWTAGDLKLVTSMAANAASAIGHALLHREHLRRQALRAQIERFVSPRLLVAAREAPGAASEPRLAVLYCDLGALARSLGEGTTPREILDTLLLATSVALDALLSLEATVHVSSSEMLVATFPHRGGFEGSARAAATAAIELRMVLEACLGVRTGIGLAAADATDEAAFLSGVGSAATSWSTADGRIMVDDAVASALGATLEVRVADAGVGTYEVVA